jgi:hypothetical protein
MTMRRVTYVETVLQPEPWRQPLGELHEAMQKTLEGWNAQLQTLDRRIQRLHSMHMEQTEVIDALPALDGALQRLEELETGLSETRAGMEPVPEGLQKIKSLETKLLGQQGEISVLKDKLDQALGQIAQCQTDSGKARIPSVDLAVHKNIQVLQGAVGDLEKELGKMELEQSFPELPLSCRLQLERWAQEQVQRGQLWREKTRQELRDELRQDLRQELIDELREELREGLRRELPILTVHERPFGDAESSPPPAAAPPVDEVSKPLNKHPRADSPSEPSIEDHVPHYGFQPPAAAPSSLLPETSGVIKPGARLGVDPILLSLSKTRLRERGLRW